MGRNFRVGSRLGVVAVAAGLIKLVGQVAVAVNRSIKERNTEDCEKESSEQHKN